MGRIRTIKPEFTTDEELSTLSAETHLFAAGLLTYADDDGYFNANPGLVKAAIFPLRECSVSTQVMLNQLEKIGFIRLGKTSDGKNWGQIVKFTVHQYVNRPTPSKIKCLEIVWEDSVINHGALTESSVAERKGKEVSSDAVLQLPEWISSDSWNAFVEMRKKIKKPLTDHAKKVAIRKLDGMRSKGFDPNESLDASTMNDWQGLFEPKQKQAKKWVAGDPKNPADWSAARLPMEDGL